MPNFQNQRIPSRAEFGTAVIPDEVHHLVGIQIVCINSVEDAPEGTHMLILVSEAGGWRCKLGDHSGEEQSVAETEFPAANVTDGSGAFYIGDGKTLPLSTPDLITVQSYDEDSILTYFWI